MEEDHKSVDRIFATEKKNGTHANAHTHTHTYEYTNAHPHLKNT